MQSVVQASISKPKLHSKHIFLYENVTSLPYTLNRSLVKIKPDYMIVKSVKLFVVVEQYIGEGLDERDGKTGESNEKL